MDNDDIEDAIEDSTQELVSSEQVVARYETLVTLWTHRDAMMLQWPSIIISASAAVLAIVFGQKTSEQIVAIASWQNWGDPSRLDVSIGAGMPVLFTGLLALPFAYAFYRSGEAMNSIAVAIMEIEHDRFSIPPHGLIRRGEPSRWVVYQATDHACPCTHVLLDGVARVNDDLRHPGRVHRVRSGWRSLGFVRSI